MVAQALLSSLLWSYWTGPSLESMPTDSGCAIQMARQGPPAPAGAAVPVADADGLAVAWQDGDTIFFSRFSRTCERVGPIFTVASSRDMWRQPGTAALGDVAALGGGAFAITWVAGGGVFV